MYQQSNDNCGSDTRGQQLTGINYIDLGFISLWLGLCLSLLHNKTLTDAHTSYLLFIRDTSSVQDNGLIVASHHKRCYTGGGGGQNRQIA